jgi:hypothetical protein
MPLPASNGLGLGFTPDALNERVYRICKDFSKPWRQHYSTSGGSDLKLCREVFTLYPTMIHELRPDGELRYAEMLSDI